MPERTGGVVAKRRPHGRVWEGAPVLASWRLVVGSRGKASPRRAMEARVSPSGDSISVRVVLSITVLPLYGGESGLRGLFPVSVVMEHQWGRPLVHRPGRLATATRPAGCSGDSFLHGPWQEPGGDGGIGLAPGRVRRRPRPVRVANR